MAADLDSEAIRRVQEVFGAVCDESPERRESRIVRLCAGLPQVEARVRALLARADRDDPLDAPHANHAEPHAALRPEGPETAAAPLERGAVVGDYEVVEVLGRHTFRVVSLRHSGCHDLLRLHRSESDSGLLRSAFAELHARLREFDSPYIAEPLRIVDLEAQGLGEGRWLGLAREFVPGIPLLEHCQDLRTSFDEVIRLYRQVCWAIHRAHRRDVIHAALRHDRLLLRTDRDPPTAVVLDFGLIATSVGTDAARDRPDRSVDLRAVGALLPELCGMRLHRSLGMARAVGMDRRAPAAAAETFLRLLQAAATDGDATGSPTRRLVTGMHDLSARLEQEDSQAHRAFAEALREDCRLLVAGDTSADASRGGPRRD